VLKNGAANKTENAARNIT